MQIKHVTFMHWKKSSAFHHPKLNFFVINTCLINVTSCADAFNSYTKWKWINKASEQLWLESPPESPNGRGAPNSSQVKIIGVTPLQNHRCNLALIFWTIAWFSSRNCAIYITTILLNLGWMTGCSKVIIFKRY